MADRADKRPLLKILALIAAAAAVYFAFIYGFGYAFETGLDLSRRHRFATLALLSSLLFFAFIIWFVIALADNIVLRLSGTKGTTVGQPHRKRVGLLPHLLARLAAGLVAAPVALFLTILLWISSLKMLSACVVNKRVETQEQALALSKQFILANEMERLGQYRIDASIFDHSEVGRFIFVCDRPP